MKPPIVVHDITALARKRTLVPTCTTYKIILIYIFLDGEENFDDECTYRSKKLLALL